MSLIDMISICITLAGLIEIAVILFMLLTQKKRIARKQITYKKEISRLRVHLAVLIPVLCLTVLTPNTIPYLMGYGLTSYQMVGVWLPYSLLTAFFVTDAAVLLMIVTSITRFFRCKHFVYLHDSSML